MRLRTLLALGIGAAAGAGAAYLLDPDHGLDRRAEVRSRARERARVELTDAAGGLSRQARDLLRAAGEGFGETYPD